MKRLLLFLLLVLPTMALLYFSLTRNPRDLPSALVGKPAPNFILQTLTGETVTLSSLKGKPVVLNFWSTWCGSCVGEHHVIREAVRMTQGENISIYSILYEDTPENALRFIGKYGKAAPVLLDLGLKAAIDYGVAGVPETFFIDPNGIVRHKHTGMLTLEVFQEQVETF